LARTYLPRQRPIAFGNGSVTFSRGLELSFSLAASLSSSHGGLWATHRRQPTSPWPSS
jgi:hypothetical protein